MRLYVTSYVTLLVMLIPCGAETIAADDGAATIPATVSAATELDMLTVAIKAGLDGAFLVPADHANGDAAYVCESVVSEQESSDIVLDAAELPDDSVVEALVPPLGFSLGGNWTAVGGAGWHIDYGHAEWSWEVANILFGNVVAVIAGLVLLLGVLASKLYQTIDDMRRMRAQMRVIPIA